MGALGLVASVAVSVVLAVSGTAKLLDRDGTREAVAGFGLPAALVPVVAALLAPAELLAAVLSLVPATRTLGLSLAAVLLIAFTLVVMATLRSGRRPECHCFGRLGSAEISGRTVVRNLVLLLLVAVGLVGTSSERPSGSSAVVSVLAGVLLGAALLGGEWLTGRAERRRQEERDEALYEQTSAVPAPDFDLPDLSGRRISLADLRAPGRPVLLVTLAPGCGPCKALRPEVAEWARLLDSKLTVAVLATGSLDANQLAYANHPDLPVLVDEDGVREALGSTGTPSAVLIEADGTLSRGVANGEVRVRRLLASALAGVELGGPVDADERDDDMNPDDLDLDSVVRPRSTVDVQTLGESQVLVDTSTGGSLVLDRLGSLVWSVLDGRGTLGEISADLAEVFEAPVDQVGADVLELARKLAEAGLLDGQASRGALR